VPSVGFTDQTAQGTIQPFPWRYVGIASPDTPDPTNITFKREIFNFVFNWMANASASAYDAGRPCDPFVNLCRPGEVCVGWQAGQVATTDFATMGRCATSTARFVQALSTRIWYPNVSTQLLIEEPLEFENNYSWPVDPLWVESNWAKSTPTVRMYQSEPKSVEVAVMVSGAVLTIATAAVAYLSMRMFEKQLKQD